MNLQVHEPLTNIVGFFYEAAQKTHKDTDNFCHGGDNG
jgi:hypothetical protein